MERGGHHRRHDPGAGLDPARHPAAAVRRPAQPATHRAQRGSGLGGSAAGHGAAVLAGHVRLRGPGPADAGRLQPVPGGRLARSPTGTGSAPTRSGRRPRRPTARCSWASSRPRPGWPATRRPTRSCMFRLLATLGAAATAWFAFRIIRDRGGDTVQALWLLSASPIVLFNFVVAGHNDALMLAFIVAGMFYALRGRPWIALVLVAGGHRGQADRGDRAARRRHHLGRAEGDAEGHRQVLGDQRGGGVGAGGRAGFRARRWRRVGRRAGHPRLGQSLVRAGQPDRLAGQRLSPGSPATPATCPGRSSASCSWS